MPQGVATIARKYLTRPVEIVIGKRNEAAANLVHVVYLLQPDFLNWRFIPTIFMG